MRKVPPNCWRCRKGFEASTLSTLPGVFPSSSPWLEILFWLSIILALDEYPPYYVEVVRSRFWTNSHAREVILQQIPATDANSMFISLRNGAQSRVWRRSGTWWRWSCQWSTARSTSPAASRQSPGPRALASACHGIGIPEHKIFTKVLKITCFSISSAF